MGQKKLVAPIISTANIVYNASILQSLVIKAQQLLNSSDIYDFELITSRVLNVDRIESQTDVPVHEVFYTNAGAVPTVVILANSTSAEGGQSIVLTALTTNTDTLVWSFNR